MKKKFICILVNIFLLLVVYVGLEYFCYLGFINAYGLPDMDKSEFSEMEKFRIFSYKKDFVKVKQFYLDKINGVQDVFPFYTFKGEGNKNILVLGCSMAYGAGLSIEETISYRLNKILGSTVINSAIPGGGLQHIIYLLSLPEYRNFISKDCKYIIYFYNPDHTRRMISLTTPFVRENHFVFYKKNKDGLALKKHVFLNESYLIQKLYDITFFSGNNYRPKWFIGLWNRHFQNLFNQFREIYPNSKLIIVKFSRMMETEEHQYLPKGVADLVIDIPSETGIDVMTPENELVYTVDRGGTSEFKILGYCYTNNC